MKDMIERTKGIRKAAEAAIYQAYERGYKDGEADAKERYKEQTKEDKLKPCPFCGDAAAIAVSWNPEYPTTYHVVCYACDAKTSEYPREEDAVEAWNRRAKE